MYDPNNPVPPGDFSITSHQTLGAGPKPFDSLQGGMMNALAGQPMGNGWKPAYQQAKMDWRGQMPVQGDMSQLDWRNALMGWRDMKPDRGMFKHGQMPGQPPVAPAPVQPAPQALPPINGQLPTNPYGG